MGISEIVMILVGCCTVLGSLVTVVWALSNRPNYEYCDKTFQRKDLHDQQYETIINALEKIQEDIESLKNGNH